MAVNPKMLSGSDATEWRTPPALYAYLDERFHFQIDAAASEENALCAAYFTKEDDALARDWCFIATGEGRSVYLNPPYKGIEKWMQKAHEEAEKGCTVVCLVAARTDSRWFHKYVLDAYSVILLQGRVPFLRPDGTPGGSPAFPSAIVVFKRREFGIPTTFGSLDLRPILKPKERTEVRRGAWSAP